MRSSWSASAAEPENRRVTPEKHAAEPEKAATEQPIFSPEAKGTRYFCFCSSVPKAKIGQEQREVCADTVTEVEAQYFASISQTQM
jgi:hypothetical protein